MAEDDNTSNTAFPNPPIYWQSFTKENISAFDTFQKHVKDSNSEAIPIDLKNLRPPTPPRNGEYRIFGENRALTAPLQDLPEETSTLLPADGPVSSPQHLLNLTRSLMLSYLELLHIMAINPEPPIYGIKWEDLRDLFKNAHRGLNMYRPWQAKESLIRLLEQTRDNARAEIQGIQALKVKVDTILQDVAQTCEHIGAGGEENFDKDGEMVDDIEAISHERKGINGVNRANGDKYERQWSLVNQEPDHD